MSTQIIIVLATLLAFVVLGFMLNRSINNLNAKKEATKKNNGKIK
jgi:hypothetical protein